MPDLFPLLLHEVGQTQFGRGDEVRLEALPKKLAPNADSGEIDARWLVSQQVGNGCLHPIWLVLGNGFGRILRWTRVHSGQYQIAASDCLFPVRQSA